VADDTYHVRDTRFAALDSVVAAAQSVVGHWHEFGAEYGLDECMEGLERALRQWQRFWPGEEPHG